MRERLLEFENVSINRDEEEEYIASKRYILKCSNLNDVLEKGLEQFVEPTTKQFFHRFNLKAEF